MGPAELTRAVAIARMYYLEELSKSQIAERTGLSRFKVARILADCLAQGIVTITIASPSNIDPDLSEQLGERFGLRHALVVHPTSGNDADLRADLGRAAAQLLGEILDGDDVLGVGWGRTLTAIADHLDTLPACPVVQMTGVTSSDMDNSMELVRRISEVSGGRPYPIFAPLVLPDATTAAGLLRQPDLAAATNQFGTITKAIVAVGSWDPPNSQLRGVMTPRERDDLARLGVQAEVCGALLDQQGQEVDTDMRNRMIAVGIDQLRDIPELIAVAGGASKEKAILAVLRSGLVNSLITDDAVARGLLAAAG
ncbi:transcriptional regulator [Nakamurella sp. YIM 132087]|uniref:Transcriptional regulator n=1 Tax=Nakamurella alba TaxID=2665158 RepID=A0A7K1FQ79_9ACTN|nr:sugar-binding domain-containing protein [Nakamurella alba]MTD16305.1 transcriptional regulator [Nakamurella alba]